MRAREFEELYTRIMDGLVKGMQERRLTPDNFYENLNWMRNSLIDQMTQLDVEQIFTRFQVSELMILPDKVMLKITGPKKQHV